MADLSDSLYRQVRLIAASRLRAERATHTMRATDLAHEVLLRLVASDPDLGGSREEILMQAARKSRQVLVDHARTRDRIKRGAGVTPLRLVIDPVDGGGRDEIDLLELEQALERLSELSPREADVVVLRVHGGLAHATIAEVLGVSLRTVEADWMFARAWLRREILRARSDAERRRAPEGESKRHDPSDIRS